MPRRLLGLLLAVLLFPRPAAAQPAPGAVVINEILYAPSPSDNEFIELYNRSDTAVALQALSFADANRTFDPVTAADTALAPGAYAVLVRTPSAFADAFPSASFFAPSGWDALNNGGDTVVLRHSPSGTALDSVPYDPSWGGGDGRALERIDPRGPSNRASNFTSSAAPAGATPGVRNSQFARDTQPPRPAFAEQSDSLAATVVFDEPVAAASIHPGAFGLGETPIVQATPRTARLVRLSLAEPPTASALVVRDVRDLVGNRLDEARVPFAHRPHPGALVVNEILFDPLADDFDERPNQVEYVELHNRTDVPLTLNGILLTDRPTEAGVADTLRAGRQRAVLPGGFAVVAAAPNGAERAQQSQLAAAFPEAPLSADATAYLPVDAVRLGLRNGGDRIRVHRRDRAVVATVDYVPDWHSPGLADPKGTALERLSPSGRANVAGNWTSSPSPNGGTPGAPNAASLPPPETAPAAAGLRIRPDPFSLERDGATRIQFSLDAVPGLVRVRIYDAQGRKVRTLEQARLAGRSGEVVWNGRDDAGNRVRIGPYVVLFEAVRAEGGTATQLTETVVVARPLN
jgi:hypothetical protein